MIKEYLTVRNIVIVVLLIIVTIMLHASGLLLPALALVMTLILHPWVIFPIVGLALILVFFWGWNSEGKK